MTTTIPTLHAGPSAPAEHPAARRLGSSATGFVAAVVVASAGAGLAVPHLTKEGMVAEAWLGAAAAALGGAGSVWTARRLLRALPRRWWLLAMPLLLIVTCLGFWTVGQGVAAGLPARPELGTRTPADVGLDHRDVTVRTEDGVSLAAWWVPSENGAAVVLLHGAGSTRTAVLDHARVIAGHGYGVLLLDARGHGESTGRGMDFGWYGEQDVAAAVDFVLDQPGTGPVGLVGMSMGGEEAIGAAGVDPRVGAVVAEGATNRVAADKAFLAEEYGVRGALQQQIDLVTYAVAGLLTTAPEPATLWDSIAATQDDGTPTPVLLVTGGDVRTEQLAATYLDGAAPDAVERWTVPGAGHVQGLSQAPQEWEDRVSTFLDAALLGRAGD